MVKPMPQGPLTPSLAESFSASEDGLTYDFVLRDGPKFHNGEPVTAEDVKFSFQRYRGASHEVMAGRVAAIETADDRHVSFKLKNPGRILSPSTGRPPAPAGSCRRNMSRRSATRATKRHRSAPAPTNSSRLPLASNWCSRPSRGTGARPRGQAAGWLDPRRGDAAGRAEERRNRHHLFDPRRARRGGEALSRPDPETGLPARAVLADFRQSVGCKIAMA